MSVQTIQNNIERTQRELQSLHQKLTDETKKEATKSERISQIKRGISKYTSASVLQSYQNEIARLERDIVDAQKKRADLTKQVSDKTTQLHKYQQELFREQEREQKKFMDSLKRQQDESRRRQDDLLYQVRSSVYEPVSTGGLLDVVRTVKYDAFISHASEDKEDLVRPLAEKLKAAGFSIWYDEFELTIGDRLRRSIDRGLSNSRFGIVVLSPDFFAKNWPQYELDGLVAKEMTGGKVILPLWHKVSKDEVIAQSPTLADRVALNTATFSIDELVEELAKVLKQD